MKNFFFRSAAFALAFSLTLALPGNALAQTWSGSTPGDIYYDQGKVGIGTSPSHTFDISSPDSVVARFKRNAENGTILVGSNRNTAGGINSVHRT